MSLLFSKYNYVYQNRQGGGYVIFNYLSNALLPVDSSFLNLIKDPSSGIKRKDFEFLLDSKILVEDDQKEIDEIVSVRQQIREIDILDIAIYPTLGCNFKCPYCFQLDYKQNTMSKETLEATLNFIKHKIKTIKPRYIQITWLGGEPLLCLDKMLLLAKSIKKLISNKCIFSSKLITNGYYIDDFFISKAIDSLNLTSVQITIDGNKEEHNSTRVLSNGSGSYEKIIKNVDKLLSKRTDLLVVIRTNITKDRRNKYSIIHSELSKVLTKTPQLLFSIGFVDDYTLSCKSNSDNGCFLDRREKGDFYLNLHKKHGINLLGDFLPKVSINSCMARHKNSYAIGPTGKIYKCTTVVGDPNHSVGNVMSFPYISNKIVLNQWLESEDYLKDKKCRDCHLFPVCDGGCPLLRMKHNYIGYKIDTCAIFKGREKQFINTHIKSLNK